MRQLYLPHSIFLRTLPYTIKKNPNKRPPGRKHKIRMFLTSISFLPPALAEEIIFLVASVCLCVCLSVCLRSAGCTVAPTDLNFGTHIKDHYISDKFGGKGHRSKVKVKNVKILVFSLLPEKVVQGQGHGGKVTEVKVKGRKARVKVVGQGHRVKVNFVEGTFLPHRLAGGAFSLHHENWTIFVYPFRPKKHVQEQFLGYNIWDWGLNPKLAGFLNPKPIKVTV